MILESAVFPPRRLFESFSIPLSGIGRIRFTLWASVENDPTAREAVFNWFGFPPWIASRRCWATWVLWPDLKDSRKRSGYRVSLAVLGNRRQPGPCRSGWPRS